MTPLSVEVIESVLGPRVPGTLANDARRWKQEQILQQGAYQALQCMTAQCRTPVAQ